MSDLVLFGQQAKAASQKLALLDTTHKNQLLEKMADAIEKNSQLILNANAKDLAKAKENGITDALLDRLRLT